MRHFYTALVTLPDRLYPFKMEVDGRFVRGLLAYQARLAEYEATHGPGRYGYRLEAYRQLFHLVGSILFLSSAAWLSNYFFPGTDSIFVFLAIAIFFITFQEFYLHRRLYQQLWGKGALDWFSWCAPIGVYLLYFAK